MKFSVSRVVKVTHIVFLMQLTVSCGSKNKNIQPPPNESLPDASNAQHNGNSQLPSMGNMQPGGQSNPPNASGTQPGSERSLPNAGNTVDSTPSTSWFYDSSGPKFQYDRFRNGCFDQNNVEGLNTNYIGECADFRKADLSNRDFSYGSFLGADFSEANLVNVNFTGSDLRNANLLYTNWTGGIFNSARYNKNSKLPFSEEIAHSLKLEHLSYEGLDLLFKKKMNAWLDNNTSPLPNSIKELIELDVDFLIDSGFYVFKSIELSNYSFLNFILKRGLKLNTEYKYKFGKTFLGTAVSVIQDEQQALLMATYLLDNGADPNLKRANGFVPLAEITLRARRGNLDLAKLLLDRGADVNSAGGGEGSSLLLVAIVDRYQSFAKLLLERGANPSFCNIKNTCSTLEYAFQLIGADLAVSLLDKGADASVSFSKPSLLDYTNDLVLLKKLVLNGAPAVKATIWSRTDADTIAFLVRSGANIDSFNPDTGRTLLLESAKSDNFNLAQQALSFNANVNIQDKDNNSALSYAVARGNLPLVKLLLSNGSNPDVTVDGNRALYIAVYAGREDIFLALAEAGAPINNVYPGSSRYYERSGSAFFTYVKTHILRSNYGRFNKQILNKLLSLGANINARGTADFPVRNVNIFAPKGLPSIRTEWDDRSSYISLGVLAFYSWNRDFFNWLYENNAKLDGVQGDRGITLAHRASTIDEFQLLIDKGIAIDGVNDAGQNALFNAKNVETALWLLEHGVAPIFEDKRGDSPLAFYQFECDSPKNNSKSFVKLFERGFNPAVLSRKYNLNILHLMMNQVPPTNQACLIDIWNTIKDYNVDLNQNWSFIGDCRDGECKGFGLLAMGFARWKYDLHDRQPSRNDTQSNARLIQVLNEMVQRGYNPALENSGAKYPDQRPLMDFANENKMKEVIVFLKNFGL